MLKVEIKGRASRDSAMQLQCFECSSNRCAPRALHTTFRRSIGTGPCENCLYNWHWEDTLGHLHQEQPESQAPQAPCAQTPAAATAARGWRGTGGGGVLATLTFVGSVHDGHTVFSY